jgi:hypothetical protein
MFEFLPAPLLLFDVDEEPVLSVPELPEVEPLP